MLKHYGLLGLVLIFLSYALALANPFASKGLQFSLEYLGITIGFSLIFDALEYKLHKKSFLRTVELRPSLFLRALLVGVLVGMFFEYFGAFVSNLWWEPYYTFLATKPFWLAILIWFVTDILIGYGSLFLAILGNL